MAQITYTIPTGKLSEFKIGFLRCYPIPLDEHQQPIMTENEWIKEWGKRQFLKAYRSGKQQLAHDNLNLESGLFG
jgi:hypothetical protein